MDILCKNGTKCQPLIRQPKLSAGVHHHSCSASLYLCERGSSLIRDNHRLVGDIHCQICMGHGARAKPHRTPWSGARIKDRLLQARQRLQQYHTNITKSQVR